MMAWTRARAAAIVAEAGPEGGALRITPVGAHAYADESRAMIERNLRVASAVAVIGTLLLVGLVYRWLPAVVLTILPTFLAILWTTGLISSYPGEINLISLAFIAILTGLGDDQVTYSSRVPQEVARAGRRAEPSAHLRDDGKVSLFACWPPARPRSLSHRELRPAGSARAHGRPGDAARTPRSRYRLLYLAGPRPGRSRRPFRSC
jgi:hypothetical protein